MKSIGSPFNITRMERYQAANNFLPSARQSELDIIDSLFPVERKGCVLEIGSGSGYLTNFLLARGMVVDTVDPSGSKIAGARKHFQEDASSGFPFIPGKEKYDLLISLASFHHIADSSINLRAELVDDFYRVTKPNGYLLIVDVPNKLDEIDSRCMDSEIAAEYTSLFFARIVEKYSSPFHKGVYLRTDSIEKQLVKNGWKSIFRQNFFCPWQFPSLGDLNEYLSLLFNIPELSSISEYNSIIEDMTLTSPGRIEFLWALSAMLFRRS